MYIKRKFIERAGTLQNIKQLLYFNFHIYRKYGLDTSAMDVAINSPMETNNDVLGTIRETRGGLYVFKPPNIDMYGENPW